MKIAAIHLKNYIDYAQVRGLTWAEFQMLIKKTPHQLASETAQVSEKEFYSCLELISNKLKDELWGIKAGNFISLKLLGLIYQISLLTTTIEEALHYLQSYLTATLPLIKSETNLTDKRAIITLSIDNKDSLINRELLENTQTIIAREIVMMCTNDITIRLGTPFYNHTYPEGWYKAIAFTVNFKTAILKGPLQKRRELHLDVLIPEYLKLIAELKPGDSFANKVKVAILSMSDPQLPDIQRISSALYLTPRSLQRRLGTENITFRKLLQEVKKQICTYMLRHEQYTVTAISNVLGYSEPASFIHAFQKWYGDSPEKMRARLTNDLQ